jgi:hypothetical protein
MVCNWTGPGQSIDHLGFKIDTANMTLSVPRTKRWEAGKMDNPTTKAGSVYRQSHSNDDGGVSSEAENQEPDSLS